MDPITILAIIAAAVSGIGAIAEGISSYQQNQENLERQEDLQKYNEELQQKVFEREDSAMQRAMDDYEKAGVNPLLAIGNPYSSTGTVQQIAPQSNYKPGILSGLGNALRSFSDIKEQSLDRNIKKKQEELVSAQVKGQTLANSERELALEVARHNFDYYKKNGLPTNASGIPKQVVEGFSALENNFFKDGINSDSLKKVGEWFITPSRYSSMGIPISTTSEVTTPSGEKYIVKDKRSIYERARSWWIKRRSNAAKNYFKTFTD